MAVELPRGLNLAKLAVFGASAPVVAHSAILALPESGTAKYAANTVVEYGNYVVVWMFQTPPSADVLQRAVQAYNDRNSPKSVVSSRKRSSRDSQGADADFAAVGISGGLMMKKRKFSDGSFNESDEFPSFVRSNRTVTTRGHPEPVAAVGSFNPTVSSSCTYKRFKLDSIAPDNNEEGSDRTEISDDEATTEC